MDMSDETGFKLDKETAKRLNESTYTSEEVTEFCFKQFMESYELVKNSHVPATRDEMLAAEVVIETIRFILREGGGSPSFGYACSIVIYLSTLLPSLCLTSDQMMVMSGTLMDIGKRMMQTAMLKGLAEALEPKPTTN